MFYLLRETFAPFPIFFLVAHCLSVYIFWGACRPCMPGVQSLVILLLQVTSWCIILFCSMGKKGNSWNQVFKRTLLGFLSSVVTKKQPCVKNQCMIFILKCDTSLPHLSKISLVKCFSAIRNLLPERVSRAVPLFFNHINSVYLWLLIYFQCCHISVSALLGIARHDCCNIVNCNNLTWTLCTYIFTLFMNLKTAAAVFCFCEILKHFRGHAALYIN